MNGKGIGYLDYEILNWYDKLGQLGAVVAAPHTFGNLIEQKIKTNAYHVVVSGGDSPPNLEHYWDGVVGTLNRIKAEVRGFDYLVPANEDPLKDTGPVSAKRQIRVN
jgi:hypothetical protein